MIVFGGTTAQVLAREVAGILGVHEGSLEVKRFPDGEGYMRIETPVEGEDCVLVQSIARPHDSSFFELLSILDTLTELGAGKITAVVPYYGYGRQDKRFREGEAITSRMIAKHICLNAHGFLTINLHKEAIQDFFDIPARNLDAMALIGDYFKAKDLPDPIVVGPDKGASYMATAVAEALGCGSDFLEKKRLGPGQVEMKPKTIDVAGKDIILVDDIIDSGGTMLTALKMLKSHNANSVHISCVHPVLTGNIITRLYAAGAGDVVATNTIASQISTISVAPLIASALK